MSQPEVLQIIEMPEAPQAAAEAAFTLHKLYAAADFKLLQIFARDLQTTRGVYDCQFHEVVLLAVGFLHTQRLTCHFAVAHRDHAIDVTRNARVVTDDEDR